MIQKISVIIFIMVIFLTSSAFSLNIADIVEKTVEQNYLEVNIVDDNSEALQLKSGWNTISYKIELELKSESVDASIIAKISEFGPNSDFRQFVGNGNYRITKPSDLEIEVSKSNGKTIVSGFEISFFLDKKLPSTKIVTAYCKVKYPETRTSYKFKTIDSDNIIETNEGTTLKSAQSEPPIIQAGELDSVLNIVNGKAIAYFRNVSQIGDVTLKEVHDNQSGVTRNMDRLIKGQNEETITVYSRKSSGQYVINVGYEVSQRLKSDQPVSTSQGKIILRNPLY